ncbi:hypothetical protein [Conexibacter sp. W3-3-2]|uniref:hypothetical protein n=1 Tax=Conexibacter sp. W3-3-2 TaxID=2675227 RepID=UPI0018A88382|nr:hypothetical protein [Conexibacter sp. W3-3-2]
MRIHEYALGPICWVLNEGLRVVDGRMPVSLFGAGHELLTDGRAPMPLVPGIRTGGGTAHAGDALLLASDHIDRHDASRPRAVWCISDGDWSDTAAGVTRIREMRDLGIPTLHISIGRPPLAVEADAITTITDPADAMTLIADHTVELIAGQARRRGRR